MKISNAEYRTRLKALQGKLSVDKIDTLIVSEEEDIYYLTGLTYKSLERLFLLIVKIDRVVFILPKMELAHLESVENVDQILCYWEYPAPSPDRWQDILYEAVKNDTRIGVSPKSPYEISNFLIAQDLAVKESDLIEKMRWIKSDAEMTLIKRACSYCDIAIDSLNRNAYFGMTELEVFAIGKDIQKRVIKETDFDYLSSNILVAAWPSRISYQPHGIPKVDDLLIEGSHISLAFLRVNGYAAELERTFFTAPPTKEQAEIFEIMLEARKRSYAALKAGVIAEEVDLASRSFLIKEGFEQNLMHRTGHGIGLGNHEGPYLAIGDKTVLKENMVVSIEPGIYIEGVGGFRHSDTVRITKDGFEILTNCQDDLSNLIFTASKPLQKLKGMLVKRMFNLKS
ncbi:MAG: Xaa-Pro peptidase family protein [Bacteroidota bacterium]